MRKPTTVVHVGLGVVAALAALSSACLAVLLFGGFALYEYWQEKKVKDSGCTDFWEGLLGLGMTTTLIVAAQLFRAVN
ncbi:MAG: hypothetical protein JW846_08300 [Dehalococcoidia bacterium]|nr:hypothetical protein [Dehalococcoidia bacterium]